MGQIKNDFRNFFLKQSETTVDIEQHLSELWDYYAKWSLIFDQLG